MYVYDECGTKRRIEGPVSYGPPPKMGKDMPVGAMHGPRIECELSYLSDGLNKHWSSFKLAHSRLRQETFLHALVPDPSRSCVRDPNYEFS
jgi:hypothetical protein